ncbi:MAG: hypothetical protein IJG82_09490 [Atopobiaceae bacterium]|nr:hypothetical protein [Atopobiaceae bacterium]
MTWKDLEDAIKALPDELKNRDACIWVPFDWIRPFPNDDFVEVTCMSCFDRVNDLSEGILDENNFPALIIDEL